MKKNTEKKDEQKSDKKMNKKKNKKSKIKKTEIIKQNKKSKKIKKPINYKSNSKKFVDLKLGDFKFNSKSVNLTKNSFIYYSKHNRYTKKITLYCSNYRYHICSSIIRIDFHQIGNNLEDRISSNLKSSYLIKEHSEDCIKKNGICQKIENNINNNVKKNDLKIERKGSFLLKETRNEMNHSTKLIKETYNFNPIADGNSFFRCISYALFKNEDCHMNLRFTLANKFFNNEVRPPNFLDAISASVLISSNGYWATSFDIKAMEEILKIMIITLNFNDTLKKEPDIPSIILRLTQQQDHYTLEESYLPTNYVFNLDSETIVPNGYTLNRCPIHQCKETIKKYDKRSFYIHIGNHIKNWDFDDLYK